MNKHCLNCNTELSDNYCSKCGQAANTRRISISFLWKDIQHGLLHVDKGIVFTAKELFTRPGHSIREFIEGKRVKHFKPLSLVLVLAGVYSFLAHYSKLNLLANKIQVNGSGEVADRMKHTIGEYSEWVSQHYAIVTLIQIPIFAFATYIAFKKVNYNYVEHLVIQSYLAAQRLFLHLLTFPIYYVFRSSPYLKNVERIFDIIGISIGIWALIQLFSIFPLLERIVRISLSLLIFFSIIFLIMLGITNYMIVLNR